MAGSSIFDYIHSHDRKELAEQLGLCTSKGGSSSTYFASSSIGSDSSDEGSSTPNPPRSSTPTISERVSVMSPNPSKGYDRCFCIRMKSTLTKRGVHFKSSGYRVVQIVAHLRPQLAFPSSPRKQLPPLLGLVGVAIALPPPTITELIIDNDMFVTRLSPQFKVTYCEPRIADVMDVAAEDIVNKNLYEFCHAEDLQKLQKAHIDLLNKGQVLTDYYRLMNRHGGYVWIQTCATIICNAKNVDEQNIIAINYVLSGIEYAGCVMNLEQYRAVSKHELDVDDSDRITADSDLISPPLRRMPSTASSEPLDGHGGGGGGGVRMTPHGTTGSASASVAGPRGARAPHAVSSLTQSGTTTPQAELDDEEEFDGIGFSGTNVDHVNKSLTPTIQSSSTSGTVLVGRRKNSNGGEENDQKTAAANSRRKTDKPRKRKRVPADLAAEAKLAKIDNGSALAVDLAGSNAALGAPGESVGGDRSLSGRAGVLLTTDVRSSPLPEDLSTARASGGSGGGIESPVRSTCEMAVATCRPVSPRQLQPPLPNNGDANNTDVVDEEDDNVHDVWMLAATAGVVRGSGPSTSPLTVGGDVAVDAMSGRPPSVAGRSRSNYGAGGTSQQPPPSSSSVHDLEAVLNKHLPDASSSSTVSDVVVDQIDHLLYGSIGRQPATSLAVQQQLQQQQQRSAAIQWIGAAAAAASSNVVPDSASSALLRSLQQQQQQYPSTNQRESVIRTNAYCSSNGGLSSSHHQLQQQRQHQQYYTSGIDAQAALLTPPGAADLYRGDSSSIAAAYGLLPSKSPPSQDAIYGSGGSVSSTNGRAMSASGYGATDPYAVTPPSSVSPLQQDAYSAAAAAQYALDHALLVDGLYQQHQHHAGQQQHHHHLQSAAHLTHHSHQQQAAGSNNHLGHFGGSSAIYRHQPIKPHAAYGSNGSSAVAAVTGSALAYEQSMTSYQQAAAAAAAMAAGYYYPPSPVAAGATGAGTLQAAAAVYGAHYRDAMKHANAW